MFPKAKILALTATATTKMQKEIAEILGMKSYSVVQGNIDRANIKLEVKKRPAGCGGRTTVKDSYNFVFDPLISELKATKFEFPKTVVYTKLKWCGYGYEKAHRHDIITENDDDLRKHVAQYHSPCTPEVSIYKYETNSLF